MAETPQALLITGAFGWLGKRLLRLLAQGNYHGLLGGASRLRCLMLPNQDSAGLRGFAPQVEVIAGDLRNPGDCERFVQGTRGAVLFHTVGIIHPRRVREFYDINLEGTRNLLRAAAATGVRRAVVVSSNSPIGCNPHNDHLFDENSPYNPYMNYGRSKMQMELAAKEIAATTSLELVIVRPPWFYGPDQPLRQTLFFQMIKDGKVPLLGGGVNKRSMVYVDNLCQGLVRAATVERAAGQIYWIADRRPYTMSEIVDTVERLLETEFGITVSHKRMMLPGIIGDVARVADATLQSLGLYHQKIHVLSEMNKTISCSVEKAIRELGYDPHISLEEGMRRSIRWYLDQGIVI